MTPTAVIGSYTAATGIDGTTNYLLIQPGDSSTAYRKINRNVFLGVSGQPMDISSVQTVSNKILDNTNTITVKDTLFTLQDDGDTTKQSRFQLSGISTAQTRVFTLPDRSSTIATLDGAQTFTGANSFTGGSWTGGTIDNSTVTVDSIAGHTTATSGTIYGISVSSSAIQSSSAFADGIILPKALQSGTGTAWSWQPWTPTFGNFTLGNGVVDYAKFSQTGKTIRFRIHVTLGSTSTITGSIVFSLPVGTAADYVQDDSLLSDGTINTGSTRFIIKLVWIGTSLAAIRVYGVAANYATAENTTSTVPFTWASGATWQIEGSYEAA